MNRRIEILGTKPTRCHTFVLPMCDIHYAKLPYNYINCYLLDDYMVVMVFEKIDSNDYIFEKFIEKINDNDSYVKYEENLEEILIYLRVPGHNKPNFDKFIKGNYSKFDDELKELLCRYYGRESIKSTHSATVFNTIYPQKFKRKQIADRLNVNVDLIYEVLDVIDIETEKYVSLFDLEKNQLKNNIINDN